MQKLNSKVKFRRVRPLPRCFVRVFNEWFDLETESPYMLLVGKVKKEKLYNISKEEEKLQGLDKLNISRSEIRCYSCR